MAVQTLADPANRLRRAHRQPDPVRWHLLLPWIDAHQSSGHVLQRPLRGVSDRTMVKNQSAGPPTPLIRLPWEDMTSSSSRLPAKGPSGQRRLQELGQALFSGILPCQTTFGFWRTLWLRQAGPNSQGKHRGVTRPCLKPMVKHRHHIARNG